MVYDEVALSLRPEDLNCDIFFIRDAILVLQHTIFLPPFENVIVLSIKKEKNDDDGDDDSILIPFHPGLVRLHI